MVWLQQLFNEQEKNCRKKVAGKPTLGAKQTALRYVPFHGVLSTDWFHLGLANNDRKCAYPFWQGPETTESGDRTTSDVSIDCYLRTG